MVVHRYVGRRGALYLTQADAHTRADAAVRPEQIIGVVQEGWLHGEPIWPTKWEPWLRWKWLLRCRLLRWRRRLTRWRRNRRT